MQRKNIIFKMLFIILCLTLIGCSNQNSNNNHTHEYVDGVCECGDILEETYVVTFVDFDGTVLKQVSIKKNESVTAPSDPSREGYKFIGWSSDYKYITSDLTVVAQYEIILDDTIHTHKYIEGECECGKKAIPTEGLKYEISDDGTYYKVVGIEKNANSIKNDELIIGGKYNSLPVKTIASKAFYNNQSFSHLIILEGVEVIGEKAFRYCENLKTVQIPKTVKKIDSDSFGNCSILEKFIIDLENDTYSGLDNCLYSKDGKILIKYANGKTTQNYTIPDCVEIIGVRAFDDCSYLTKLSISNNIKEIQDYAFVGCDVKLLYLPSTIERITSYAMYGFNGVIYSDVKTKPTTWAFYDNKVYFDIKEQYTVTEDNIIYLLNDEKQEAIPVAYLGNPEHIIIKTYIEYNNVEYYVLKLGREIFSECDSIITVSLPEGLLEIEYRAFYSCENLQEVNIPSTVYKIHNDAFYCSIKLNNMFIPKSVVYIGPNALAYNGFGKNTTIYCEIESIPAGWHTGELDNWCNHEATVIWGYTNN